MRKTMMFLIAMVLLVGCQNEDGKMPGEMNGMPAFETPEKKIAAKLENPEDWEKIGVTFEEIEAMFEGNEELIRLNRQFIGKPAPEAIVEGMDGTRTNLSLRSGKPYIIEFMASWCPTCEQVKPEVNGYRKRTDAVEVLSVGIKDERERLGLFAGEELDSYFFAVDSDALMESYSLSFVPVFFFVDELGTIQLVYSGEITPDILSDLVEWSLGE